MTTYNEVQAGKRIRCDNTNILCNSLKYYCDGSVVFQEVDVATTTYNNAKYLGHGFDTGFSNGFANSKPYNTVEYI